MSDVPSQNDPNKPPISIPPVQGYSKPQTTQQDPLLSIVPYKNSKALISYYLGLFSILPLIGLVMGAVAIFFGREGLLVAKANPDVKGVTHAKVGIGCGLVGFLFNLTLVLIFLYAVIRSKTG